MGSNQFLASVYQDLGSITESALTPTPSQRAREYFVSLALWVRVLNLDILSIGLNYTII